MSNETQIQLHNIEQALNGDFAVTGSISTSGAIFQNTVTPTNPSSGSIKLYSKDDNRLYFLQPDGTELPVGSGSGVGMAGILGEDILAGEPVYQSSLDGKWYKAQAISGKLSNLAVASADGLTDEEITLVRFGSVEASISIPNYQDIYLSQDVAGTYTSTVPSSGIVTFIGTSKTSNALDVAIGITSYSLEVTGAEDVGTAIITGTLGETIVSGQPAYQKEEDGKWYLAKATLGTLSSLSICKTGGDTDSTGTFIQYGNLEDLTGLPNSSELFLSQTIAGEITSTEPATGVIAYLGMSRGTTNFDVSVGVVAYDRSGGGGDTGTAVITGTLGEDVNKGQAVYQKESDGKWYLAKAADGMVSSLSICLIGGSSEETGTFSRYGTLEDLSGLPADSELYLSQDTAGELATIYSDGLNIYVGISRGTDVLDIAIGVIGGSSEGGGGSAYITGTLGETVTAGQPVYQDKNNGLWQLAQATSEKISNLSVATTAGVSGDQISMTRYGSIESISGLPENAELYLSQDLPGGIIGEKPASGVIAYLGISRGSTVMDVAIAMVAYQSGSGGGSVLTGILGETVIKGDVCYQKESDSKWYKARAVEGEITNLSIATIGGSADSSITFTRYGNLTELSGLPDSKELYLSQTTAGSLTDVAPISGVIAYVGMSIGTTQLDVAIGTIAFEAGGESSGSGGPRWSLLLGGM